MQSLASLISSTMAQRFEILFPLNLSLSLNLKKKNLIFQTFSMIEQELWIDKNTGRLCLSISSKALRITGIDDRRYWSHIPTDESR
jgi:hypothetical protein